MACLQALNSPERIPREPGCSYQEYQAENNNSGYEAYRPSTQSMPASSTGMNAVLWPMPLPNYLRAFGVLFASIERYFPGA